MKFFFNTEVKIASSNVGTTRLQTLCTEIHEQPLKMDLDKVLTEQKPLLLRYFENLNAMT